MAERMYKVPAAAELLNVTKLKVYRMIRSGVIDAIDVNRPARPKRGEPAQRPSWRISQSAIDRLGARADNHT